MRSTHLAKIVALQQTLTTWQATFQMALAAPKDPRTHSYKTSTNLQHTMVRKTTQIVDLTWTCLEIPLDKETNYKLITSTMEARLESVLTRAVNMSILSMARSSLQICVRIPTIRMLSQLVESKGTRSRLSLRGRVPRRKVCRKEHRIVSWQAIRARNVWKSTNSNRRSCSSNNSNHCHKSTRSMLIQGNSSLLRKKVHIASVALTMTKPSRRKRLSNACPCNKLTTSIWIASSI